ncbi:hypothetical protein ACFPH6_06700 [Streptomyces xiangluensis]|uniref:Uncharacterized protein n=1 Tax=Streptomyces xiangluensis TaxID=2665720 RepID=A0ABV8YK53_9ACTN
MIPVLFFAPLARGPLTSGPGMTPSVPCRARMCAPALATLRDTTNPLG